MAFYTLKQNKLTKCIKGIILNIAKLIKIKANLLKYL